MSRAKADRPLAGFPPKQVWQQIRLAFLAVTIPPILEAHYARITQGLPDAEPVDTEHPAKPDIALLRAGILRVLAHLALAAMQSMQAAPDKRAEALEVANYLDSVRHLQQKLEDDLRRASAAPSSPHKIEDVKKLSAQVDSGRAQIDKLVGQAKTLGQLYKGGDGKDRIIIYIWLSTLLDSSAVATPEKLRQYMAAHASREDFLKTHQEMQAAAAKQVAVSDETLTLLWLDLFWIKPPSPKTIYDLWVPDVTQAFMHACQIPLAGPPRSAPAQTVKRKATAKAHKPAPAKQQHEAPPAKPPQGLVPAMPASAPEPPRQAPDDIAAAQGPAGHKETAPDWQAAFRHHLRLRVVEIDLPGQRINLSVLPGKSLGDTWQIASQILRGNGQEPFRCLVTGPMGAGKTLLLRKLEKLLARRGDTPLYIDCAATRQPQDTLGLLNLLTAEAVKQLSPQPTPKEFEAVYKGMQFAHALNRLWLLLDHVDAWAKLPLGLQTLLQLMGTQNLVAATVMPLSLPDDWQLCTLANLDKQEQRFLAKVYADGSSYTARLEHWLSHLPSLGEDRLSYLTLCDSVRRGTDSSALGVVTQCRQQLEQRVSATGLTLNQYLELPYQPRPWVELQLAAERLSADQSSPAKENVSQEAQALFRKHAANTLTESERLRLSWLLERFPGYRIDA